MLMNMGGIIEGPKLTKFGNQPPVGSRKSKG